MWPGMDGLWLLSEASVLKQLKWYKKVSEAIILVDHLKSEDQSIKFASIYRLQW